MKCRRLVALGVVVSVLVMEGALAQLGGRGPRGTWTPFQKRVDQPSPQPFRQSWAPTTYPVINLVGETNQRVGAYSGESQSGPLTPVPWTPAQRTHGAPVALYHGETQLAVVDLEVASRGFPFVMLRTYGSRANFDGELGYNWDHAYNRRVRAIPGSSDVAVTDGLGREDVYIGLGGGQYRSPAGIFHTLHENPNGSHVETAPSGMVFSYRPSGHLVSMSDRAGNTLTISRNAQHEILKITDTQDREYFFVYQAGRIAWITDFAGRQVVYTYDAAGDLIHRRSPLVTGTPAYPSGKTRLYSYTRGSPDARLNHNLLSVIDPAYNVNDDPLLSTPWLTVTYSVATLPGAPDFDRVESVRWGHDQGGPASNPSLVVGGTVSLAYVKRTGLLVDGNAPAGAAFRTTETDPNGNIRVHYFDKAGREVKTIAQTNRNVRPTEGDHSTLYEYTAEGLLSACILPRGNQISYLYDSANPMRRSQGNLLELRRDANGVGGGGTDLVTRFTYDPVYNQVRTSTDPRGFPAGTVPLDGNGHLDLGDATVDRYTTMNLFDYQEGTGFQMSRGVPAIERIPEGLGDQNGAVDFDQGSIVRTDLPTIQTPGPNLGDVIFELRTHNDRGQPLSHTDPRGQIVAWVYYAQAGLPEDPADLEGYLQSTTRDAGGLNLLTQYGYDTRGNRISVIDPKGQQSDFVFNELDQLVRKTSRIVTGVIRYQTDWHYDANDEVVQIDTLNLQPDGSAYTPHGVISDFFEYNILHRLVTEDQDASKNTDGSATLVRTHYTYDATLNQIALTLPGPTQGAHSGPTILTSLYDERDMLYKQTRGDNDAEPGNSPPADATVVTINYDGNGRELERIDTLLQVQGIHAGMAPGTYFPGSAAGDVTQHTRDGFDRLVSTVDGEGNVQAYTYDMASNLVQTRFTGPDDHTGGAVLRVLRQSDMTYDELSRVVQSDRMHTNSSGASVGDGLSTTTYEYDLDSKLVTTTDDRGNTTTALWDTADRGIGSIDALSNQIDLVLDANGNVLTSTETESSTDLGSAADVYVTTYTYDGLDRLASVTDPGGHVTRYFYDSRDNVVETRDAEIGTGAVGNRVLSHYDALDRLFQTVRILTSTGRGDGLETGRITTSASYDDDSLVRTRTDDLGHVTTYSYDNLGRTTAIDHPNGFSQGFAHNSDDQLTGSTDQNGTSCVSTYDGLSRLLDRSVAPAPGVSSATTLEQFSYDGLSRLTQVLDDDSIVRREYDSLSNRTVDALGPLRFESTHDGMSNRVRYAYPGLLGGAGQRLIDVSFDALNRQQVIQESGGATIATQHYKGPGRLERRSTGVDLNPVARLDYFYDSDRRVIAAVHGATTSVVARFQYGHDKTHHRLFEKRVHDGDLGDVYPYDSIYRVSGDLKNVNLSGVSPGQEILPETFSSSDSLSLTYDGAGSRDQLIDTIGWVPTTTTYVGGLINEYTSATTGATTTTYVIDNNGNVISDGTYDYEYDFRNQLVGVNEPGAALTWTQVATPATPPVRSGGAMAYHAASGKVMLFGGLDASLTYLGDTWTYDGVTWTQENPATSPGPRGQCAIAYDEARQLIVLFGGARQGGQIAETWEWNGLTWIPRNPASSPPARSNSRMAYDSSRQRIVLFGGLIGLLSMYSDTWEWDGVNWSQVATATVPMARSGHGMAYDAARGQTVMFGGLGSSLANLSDTWGFDGQDWSQLAPASVPAGRRDHVLEYNDLLQQMILFAGQDSAGVRDDTWAWDGVDWQQYSPSTSPPGRFLTHAAYDGNREQLVVFGGKDLNGILLDTWELAPGVVDVAQYSHDVLGRRVRKSAGSQTTYFLYDGDRVVEERDGVGNVLRQYVWDANGLLVETRTATTVHYPHIAAQGNVTSLSNDQGTVVQSTIYDAFGNATNQGTPTGNEFRFKSWRLYPETGLYRVGSRDYSPTLGRFLQRDSGGDWSVRENLGNGYTAFGNNIIVDGPPNVVWDGQYFIGYGGHGAATNGNGFIDTFKYLPGLTSNGFIDTFKYLPGLTSNGFIDTFKYLPGGSSLRLISTEQYYAGNSCGKWLCNKHAGPHTHQSTERAFIPPPPGQLGFSRRAWRGECSLCSSIVLRMLFRGHMEAQHPEEEEEAAMSPKYSIWIYWKAL